MRFHSKLFSTAEEINVKCGAFASGYKPLIDAVNALRTELATNFSTPALQIMGAHAVRLGLDDAQDVKRFLEALVERGL